MTNYELLEDTYNALQEYNEEVRLESINTEFDLANQIDNEEVYYARS